MLKTVIKKNCVAIFVTILILPSVLTFVNAHTLTSWRNRYSVDSANTTFSFGFMNCFHIDGNTIKYCWNNSTSKSYFNQAVVEAFDVSWKSIIAGIEESNLTSAHVTIMYDSITQPSNTVADSINYAGDSHYGVGSSVLKITFYKNLKDKSLNYKRIIAAHEIGHYWDLADLYDKSRSLDSIYSNIDTNTTYTSVSRHDLNAMRIALNDLWFNPGGNQVWKYQQNPGVFIMRGDMDQDGQITAADARDVSRGSVNSAELTTLQKKLADVDGDGIITSGDARLVLRYSVGSEIKFPADIYEG